VLESHIAESGSRHNGVCPAEAVGLQAGSKFAHELDVVAGAEEMDTSMGKA
jgi:hypothetical protein